MAKVGDRYVLEEMQARGAVIGGEDSGHLIFLHHHTTGDGIITALQVAAAMKKEGKPLSELARIMKVFPQVLINVDVKRGRRSSTVPEIVTAIREVEAKLGDQGRVLVRYSGTQNMCRVMVEGPSQEETARSLPRNRGGRGEEPERLSRTPSRSAERTSSPRSVTSLQTLSRIMRTHVRPSKSSLNPDATGCVKIFLTYRTPFRIVNH